MANKGYAYIDSSTGKVAASLLPITANLRVYQFAPLTSLVTTVDISRVDATGNFSSTSSNGYSAPAVNIDPFLIAFNCTVSKICMRLTQAAVSTVSVGSNPTVRIDLYKNLSASRTLIATYRIAITNNAGIGTLSTPSTLTAADTMWELTGLSDALTKGDSIGINFVTEDGGDNTKIGSVTNLNVILVTTE